MTYLERKNIFKENIKRNEITYLIEDFIYKPEENNAIFFAIDIHSHDGNVAHGDDENFENTRDHKKYQSQYLYYITYSYSKIK